MIVVDSAKVPLSASGSVNNNGRERLRKFQQSGKHRYPQATVSVIILMINLFWLAPLAFIALLAPRYSFVCISLAYAPLLAGVIIIGAGRPDK